MQTNRWKISSYLKESGGRRGRTGRICANEDIHSFISFAAFKKKKLLYTVINQPFLLLFFSKKFSY